jgi:hypothetical protein
MDIGSIFLILAVLILVGFYISRPFFEHKSVSVTKEEHEYSALMAERERILSAIQELDFDHSLGKIPEEEYPLQRASLLNRGAEVIKQLEAYKGVNGAELPRTRLPLEPAAAASLDGSIPAAKAASDNADDELEVLIANRRRARQEKSAGFCAQCGGPLQVSDKFCPKCGDPIRS